MFMALIIGDAQKIMHRDHVRTLDTRDALRFTSKSSERIRIAQQVFSNTFDRHRALERKLLTQIDFAHRSATKQRVDANTTKNNTRRQHDGARYEPLSLLKVRRGKSRPAVSLKVTRASIAVGNVGMMIG